MENRYYQLFLNIIENLNEKPLNDCFYLLGLSTLEKAYRGEIGRSNALKQSCHFLLKSLHAHPNEPRIYLTLAWIFELIQEPELVKAYLIMTDYHIVNPLKLHAIQKLLLKQRQVQALERSLNTDLLSDPTFFELLKKFIQQEMQHLSQQELPAVSHRNESVYRLELQLNQSQQHLNFIGAHLPTLKDEYLRQSLETWIKPLELLTQRLERRFVAAHRMNQLKQRIEMRLKQVKQLTQITRKRGAICTRYQEALSTLATDCQSILLEIDQLSVQGYVPVALLPIFARYAHWLDELKDLSQKLPLKTRHHQQTKTVMLYRKSLAS